MIFNLPPLWYITQGAGGGDVPPLPSGFLLNDTGGYVLQSNDGRIIISPGTLMLNKKIASVVEKILNILVEK